MKPRPIRTDVSLETPYGQERDGCAIYMSIRKNGQSTFGTMKRALDALARMGHRTGFVNGEGDGAGVQTDIPRQIWALKLSQAGLPSSLSTHPGFWVGHLFVPPELDYDQFSKSMNAHFNENGLHLLFEQPGDVRPEVLGRSARSNAPSFWQIAGHAEIKQVEKQLLKVRQELEADYAIHFASLSTYSVIYKIRGSVEALTRYYPDLKDRKYNTAMALCHARYSTNTVSTFERAQPFSLLGHNGEINTINRFSQEAMQAGAVLPRDGSDSQIVDRMLHQLCVDSKLDLFEAIEMVFPPVASALENMPPELRAVYTRIRQAFGPFAQGPAGILARYADMGVASVDALGLRPLWYVETEKEHLVSSERGVVFFENCSGDARPLAPGEKLGFQVNRGHRVAVLENDQIQQHVMEVGYRREVPQLARRYWVGLTNDQVSVSQALSDMQESEKRSADEKELETNDADPGQAEQCELCPSVMEDLRSVDDVLLSANGWRLEHLKDIRDIVKQNRDLVSSLGYDGPLAAIDPERVNLADYFKEKVAVVTNPAIDRARESEAFSTRVLIGARPGLDEPPNPSDILISLGVPLIPGGHSGLGSEENSRAVAAKLKTKTLQQITAAFDQKVSCLKLGVLAGETVQEALERLQESAVECVQNGVQCVVLDDGEVVTSGLGWMDPHLAVSVVDDALCNAPTEGVNLRRRAGIVVRSASVRTLHDIALLYGFGADAVNPYAMLAVSLRAQLDGGYTDDEIAIECQYRLLSNLQKGLEKVISTIGCHELRGYGRACSAIGLAPDIASMMRIANFFGSEMTGMTWERLNQEAADRSAELKGEQPAKKLPPLFHFYSKYWKKVSEYAKDQVEYQQVRKVYNQLTEESPVSLRHLMGFKKSSSAVKAQEVDLHIKEHDLPFVIGAMSFGSQGELSYRSFAEAALKLNIVCINGEGGELPEILGTYKKNRGQQVASGRFGVNAAFLNSVDVIEIKIGQGAKPGEGGMLPGEKISEQVARARHTTPFVPLLSPSNNHDLYSIEDLAQLIEELKMINPTARISVKCPVVPDIGVIAVGVAKAGADIINLSGYDGGTGAARKHAIQYVGLPAEIGVIQAHRALTDAGIRYKVELWCDGGMKSGSDVVKMILLGANRVGFATMAMIAIGCTACRQCYKGSCLRGIATQVRTIEEAKRTGLRGFTPLDYLHAVNRLERVFTAIGQEVQEITAQLGYGKVQDLVGRSDLLVQEQMREQIDLSSIFVPSLSKPRMELKPGVGRLLTRPRNSLTQMMSELVLRVVEEDEKEVTYQDEVMAFDRALGSHLFGEMVRNQELQNQIDCLHLRFGPSSIAGNGFASWITEKMDVLIEGGAQDGVAKGANGGRVAVMKGLNKDGLRIDGSVGKSFGYGAMKGVLVVQGNADSRACIRLSGASVVLGGEITAPLNGGHASGTTANLKGYACEYMTGGRVVILGDPGPYAFSGMTGGVVYQKLTPAMGFGLDMLHARLAKGACVDIQMLADEDVPDVQELLGYYLESLEQTHQYDVIKHIRELLKEKEILERFVKIVPVLEQTGEKSIY